MLNYTYLASKSDIESFQPNDLQKYRYIALFEFGRHRDKISETEKALVFAGLARFMHEDCLIASVPDIESAGKGSRIRPVFSILGKPQKMDAYVAIATIFPDVNSNAFLTPEFREIKVNPHESERYPFYAAINQCLADLKSSLHYASLNDIPIPEYTSTPMACPYGNKIMTLRKQIGSVNKVCQQQFEIAGGNTTFQLGRTTLSDAEKSRPVSEAKLRDIATAFKVKLSEISFTRIVPNRQRILELRHRIACDQDQLAKDFGLPTGYFFDLLHGADIIPAATMLFIFHRYKNRLGNTAHRLDFKLSFENLIDLPATEILAENPPAP